MANEKYYNKGLEITKEEAHALRDKSGLVVADREVNFETEFKGSKQGKAEYYTMEEENQPQEEEVVEEQPSEEEPQEE